MTQRRQDGPTRRAAPLWHDKLPSIAGTLAMQAALAALLLFSITAVRRERTQTETILFLPPPKPAVIDARRPPPEQSRQPSAQAAPISPPPLPAYAAPSAGLSASTGGNSALLGALGRDLENCRIEKRDPDAQCPPVLAHRETMTLDAGQPVRNAAIWQREAERKKIAGLPGLALALRDDGAVSLSGPKAIGTALDAPSLPGMTGAERLQLRRYYSPQTSRTGTDWENRVRWDSAKALGYD
jgi:hypothetical protein